MITFGGPLDTFARRVRGLSLLGTVLAVACSGDTRTETQDPPRGIILASGQNNPRAIAVDGTNVYWMNRGWTDGDGSIMKVSRDGGAPVVLASGLCNAYDLAVDDLAVYWSGGYWSAGNCDTSMGIKRISVADGSAFPPIDGGGLLAPFGEWIYFGNSGATVMRAPRDGGTPLTVAAGDGDLMHAVAVDGTNVYWSTTTGPGVVSSGVYSGRLFQAPIEGGVATLLASDLGEVDGIASEGVHAYWTDKYSAELNRVPIGGGEVEVFADGGLFPQDIKILEDVVYWSTFDAILTAPVTGGPPRVLANATLTSGIAVDKDAVYWAEWRDNGSVKGLGTIRKVAR
jgi:hypothetical protein